MPRFRKKPIEIDAVLWNGDFHSAAILEITDRSDRKFTLEPNDRLTIHTLEGDMTANIGDWIIKGVEGELYPCKPNIFDATYEPV